MVPLSWEQAHGQRMAEVDHDAAAAADAAANGEPTKIVLLIRDESFATMPWATVADIQLGYAPHNYLTPDSFVDTVVPGTVLAFKDRCSAPDKTALPVSAC